MNLYIVVQNLDIQAIHYVFEHLFFAVMLATTLKKDEVLHKYADSRQDWILLLINSLDFEY